MEEQKVENSQIGNDEEIIRPEELIRTNSSFECKGRVFKIRKFSLKDDEWLQANGLQHVLGLIETIQIKKVMRIIYHQLEECDEFMAKDVEVNEEGEKKSTRLSGPEVLLEYFDDVKVYGAACDAIMDAYGFSHRVLEKAHRIAEKKRLKKALSQQTGQESSTESQNPMGGQMKK